MRSSIRNKLAKFAVLARRWQKSRKREWLKRPLYVEFRMMMEEVEKLISFPKKCRESGGVLGDVPVLWVDCAKETDQKQVLLWLHGGGWVGGSPDTHKGMVAHIAHAAGARGCLVDYRLAPEHPYPAPLDDCVTAYRGLLETGFDAGDIVVGGDSAGGNLAMALLLRCKAEGLPRPSGAINLSGCCDLTTSGESIEARASRDPMIHSDSLNEFIGLYAPDHDLTDPLLSPLFGDFTGCPPIFATAGTEEVLWSDVHAFVDHLREQGVEVTLEEGEDMVHVWPILYDLIPEAKETVTRLSIFVQQVTHKKAIKGEANVWYVLKKWWQIWGFFINSPQRSIDFRSTRHHFLSTYNV